VANTQTVLVRVVPLADTAGASSDASPLPDGADPFAGCPAGKACSRRFLVAFAWTGYDPQDEELDWTATIRRTDLLGVWTTPATLGAKVTRRIDLADAAPAIVHAEGDVSPASTDRGPQVQLRLASRTTSDDPIAALLPVPASYTYRARLPGPSASPAIDGNGVSITARIPDAGTDPVFGGFQGGSVEVRSALATRTGACRVGQACPDLDILISSLGRNGQTPPPGTTYHWTLDVAVRSYVDVPVEVTLTP